MKCAISIEPTMECLCNMLNAVREHLGAEQMKCFFIIVWDDEREEKPIIAKYQTQSIRIDDWFTINNSKRVVVLSRKYIEKKLVVKHRDEIPAIIEQLSDEHGGQQ